MERIVKAFFENYPERVRRHYRRFLIAYKKAGVQSNNRVIANSEQMIQIAGPIGYQMRAFAYVGNGDLDRAIENMNLAIQAAPNVANLYATRGTMYGESGNFDKAIADFDKSIKEEDNDAFLMKAYYQRALAYLGKGNYELAFKDSNKALSINVQDNEVEKLESYLLRGFIYGRNGEFEKAASDFNSALQIKVSNVGKNGSIYVEADYHDDARECLKYATMTAEIEKIIADYADELRNNPNDIKIYERRGFMFLSKGYCDHAIEDYTKIIQINPDNFDAYHSRGMSYSQIAEDKRASGIACSQIKEYDEAIKDFDHVLKLNPNIASAYKLRGMAYSQKKEYNKAIVDLTEAIRLKPNDFLDYMSRGTAYFELHQYTQAKQDFEKTLELNPNVPFVKNMLEEINKEEQERIARERHKNAMNDEQIKVMCPSCGVKFKSSERALLGQRVCPSCNQMVRFKMVSEDTQFQQAPTIRQNYNQAYANVVPQLSLWGYFIHCLKNYATFSGRARRREYWGFYLFSSLFSIIPFLGGIVALGTFIPYLAVTWRRLHDTGKSGLWVLPFYIGMLVTTLGALIVLPNATQQLFSGNDTSSLIGGLVAAAIVVLIGLFIPLLIWLCTDSTPGTNKYGKNPKGM